MILVTGATGNNGSAAVARLAALGAPVRALARDAARAAGRLPAGVEVVEGDLAEAETLARALDGCDHLYLILPVHERALEYVGRAVDAARAAGVQHVVRLSAAGADPEAPLTLLRQHGSADRLLTDSGLGWTILRPGSFFQNLLMSAGFIRDAGEFYLPMRDARLAMIDTRDVADVAARTLTAPGHMGKSYHLTGPEAVSYQQVAEHLSELLGRPIHYVDVPPQAFLEGMLDSGVPRWDAEAISELFALVAGSGVQDVSDVVENVLGRPPRGLDRFLRDHLDAFR